jgi:hypothetical protein
LTHSLQPVLTKRVTGHLDARLADTGDPPFSREAEAGFERLKQRIARWERENQADRARVSQGR